MKLESIKAIQSLAAQRDTAVLRQKRLLNEPLRLVLGAGGTSTELCFSSEIIEGLRNRALAATQAEITDLEHRLRSYGVEIPGDTPPDEPPGASPPSAAAMAC